MSNAKDRLLRRERPTFVWIVAGSDDPWRLHMTAVSTASTRIQHPQSHRIWLTPRRELDALSSQLPAYLQRELRLIGVESPYDEPDLASRYIKVRLRRLIDEPRFVFLDADTLLVRPLPWSDWRFPALAACRNRDGDGSFTEELSNRYAQALFLAAGWDWSQQGSQAYFNTGFIAFSDGGHVAEFTRQWELQWDDFRHRAGKHNDQPAFNRAALLVGGVTELASEYNAPVAILPQTAISASVFHYYASGQSDWRFPHTLFGRYVGESISRGQLSMSRFRRALRRGKPFVALGASLQEYELAQQWGFKTLTELELWRQSKVRRLGSIRRSIEKRYRRWILRQPPA